MPTVRGGSSPLTRGKLPRRVLRRSHVGLIPAHAGKTNEVIIFGPFLWAHPRSRGENCMCVLFLCRLLGSSPLTRGKPSACGHADSARGLIPAHAGKTIFVFVHHCNLWAHPRSRGENSVLPARGRVTSGSSPLTRGKRPPGIHAGTRRGLIPAHAGKTRRAGRRGRRCRAHPRSRGENGAFGRARSCTTGSSPLTRGKLRDAAEQAVRSGLIPAHAGKTRPVTKRAAPSRAHPRSRGENDRPVGSRW